MIEGKDHELCPAIIHCQRLLTQEEVEESQRQKIESRAEMISWKFLWIHDYNLKLNQRFLRIINASEL